MRGSLQVEHFVSDETGGRDSVTEYLQGGQALAYDEGAERDDRDVFDDF